MSTNKYYISSLEQELRMDALEAYRSFQHARGIFFLIILIALLTLAVIFWAVDRGCIDGALQGEMQEKKIEVIRLDTTGVHLLGFTADETPQTDPQAAPALPSQDNSKSPKIIQHQPDDGTDLLENPGEVPMMPQEKTPEDVSGNLRRLLEVLTTICGYALTFSAVCYSVSLLIGLHVALMGRLGGMCDGVKSFFLSLVVLVLILPWQKFVSAEVSGVVFSFQDLIQRYITRLQHENFTDLIYYYTRFMGLWLLTLLLLLVAQWRSRMAGQMIELRAHFGRHVLAEENNQPRELPAQDDKAPIKLSD